MSIPHNHTQICRYPIFSSSSLRIYPHEEILNASGKIGKNGGTFHCNTVDYNIITEPGGEKLLKIKSIYFAVFSGIAIGLKHTNTESLLRKS